MPVAGIAQPKPGRCVLPGVVNSKRNVQPSQSEDLRARIVAAARARFKRFGYAKTGMLEIARDCGMSAANLYRFYDGKLAIGAAVAAAELTGLFASCDEAIAAAPRDPAQRLIALFYAVIDATRQQLKTAPLLFELRLVVSRERPEVRREFLREIETRIVAVLAASRKPGSGAAEPLAARGRMVLIASAPFVLPWMMQNTPFGDPRPQVAPLVRCLVAGLAAERAARSRAAASRPVPLPESSVACAPS